jgi:O-methyltransferase
MIYRSTGKCSRQGTSIREVGDSLVDSFKIDFMSEKLKEMKHPKINLVEVGVYLGGTAKVFSNIIGAEGNLWLFDTFQGMPKGSELDYHQEGDFYDTSLEDVQRIFEEKNNVHIYKGIFPKETSDIISDLEFDFVHLDVDIYESYINCLNFFYPRLKKGGLIFLDDYLKPSCNGSTIACDEFANLNRLEIQNYNGGEDTYWKTKDVFFITKNI